jgi:hypothetical protein
MNRKTLVSKNSKPFFKLEQSDDDDDEIQLKSAPVNAMHSTQSTTMNNTIELQRLTASVETMRTSILQAYI